jgi:hypothetical protein
MTMSKQLRGLMRRTQRVIDEFCVSRGLKSDAVLLEPHARRVVSIDELVCAVCDDFIDSAGCPKHPTLQKGLL